MKNKLLFFFFFNVAFVFCHAQMQSGHPFYFKTLRTDNELVSLYPSTVTSCRFTPVKNIFTFNYQPPKLPFFCAMEERSRNKFKVILKLRAGNDESYMKMITGPHKQ